MTHIAKSQLPILLSTGAATIEEIRQAVEVIEAQGNQQICIMHCTLCYPTEPKDSNLSALNDIAKHLDFVTSLLKKRNVIMERIHDRNVMIDKDGTMEQKIEKLTETELLLSYNLNGTTEKIGLKK